MGLCFGTPPTKNIAQGDTLSGTVSLSGIILNLYFYGLIIMSLIFA